MARRIPVQLTLDAQRYLTEARKVESQTAVVDEVIKALGREIDQTSRDSEKLAATTAAAKKEVKDLGDKSAKTAAEMEFLDRKIASTQRSIKNLGLEFSLTGNAVAGERLGRQQGFLAQLEKLRKEMTEPTGGAGTPFSLSALMGGAVQGATLAGGAFAKNFNDAVSKTVASQGSTPWMPILIGAAVEAAVLAAPAAGAIISGALAGAIGTVGIAGGILAASKDPVVRSAAKEFGDHISTEFFGAGAAFVDPIRESLGILQADFDKLDLAKVLAPVAPLVTTIASGFGDLVGNSIPGFAKALERMGPFADAAALGFQQVGKGISDFFNDVTRSHGAVEGLKVLFSWLAGTISFLGAAMRWLSERFHDMNKTAAAVVGVMADVAEALHLPDAKKVREVSDSLNKFADSDAPYAADQATLLGDAFAAQGGKAKEAADRMDTLNKKTEDYIQTNLDLWSANIDAAQAIADLSDKLIKGKANWDLNTQAGRDNQQQLKNTIDAIEAKRQKDVEAAHGNIDAINAVNQEYDKQLEKILGIAYAAGLAKDKVAALEGTYYMKIIVDYQVLNQQNKAKSLEDSMWKLTGERAAGGPVVAGGSYIVGEQGPEIVTFNQNGFVNTAAQTANMTQAWRGSTAGYGAAAAGPPVIDYTQFAAAISGVTVRAYLDGHDVTAVVTGHQDANISARPRL